MAFMGGGLGRPGQREGTTANTETLVTIPWLQYIFSGSVGSVVGVADLIWLYVVLQRAGTRITWIITVILLALLEYKLYRYLAGVIRWKYYERVAFAFVAATMTAWLLFGEEIVWHEFTIKLGYDGQETAPIHLLVVMAIPLAVFSYFAVFLCWGWRNDMASKGASGWTATRNQIPGQTEPENPFTRFAPMTKPTEVGRATIVRENGVPEQTTPLDMGAGKIHQLTLYDAACFLRGSEVGNRGLTRAVAESCGMRKDVHKAFVEYLQDLGLATPNGKGATSHLVKSADLTLEAIGFKLYPDDDNYENE